MTDLFSLQGKVALVTGGSRGIGYMLAEGLLRHGAKVYISARKEAACNEAAERLSAHGECVALSADLSKLDEIERLSASLEAAEDKLHVLVNNAGASWGAPLGAFPEQGWDKVMDLNAKSIFFLTQRLLPLLERGASSDDPARVVNIGSVDGIHVSPLFEAFSYGASKAAVHHLTRTLAAHLAKRNVTVNAIAPGPFESQMLSPMLDKFGDAVVNSVPLGRIGRPDDMAGAVVYLCSRAGAYVTGSVLPVDGGIVGTL